VKRADIPKGLVEPYSGFFDVLQGVDSGAIAARILLRDFLASELSRLADLGEDPALFLPPDARGRYELFSGDVRHSVLQAVSGIDEIALRGALQKVRERVAELISARKVEILASHDASSLPEPDSADTHLSEDTEVATLLRFELSAILASLVRAYNVDVTHFLPRAMRGWSFDPDSRLNLQYQFFQVLLGHGGARELRMCCRGARQYAVNLWKIAQDEGEPPLSDEFAVLDGNYIPPPVDAEAAKKLEARLREGTVAIVSDSQHPVQAWGELLRTLVSLGILDKNLFEWFRRQIAVTLPSREEGHPPCAGTTVRSFSTPSPFVRRAGDRRKAPSTIHAGPGRGKRYTSPYVFIPNPVRGKGRKVA